MHSKLITDPRAALRKSMTEVQRKAQAWDHRYCHTGVAARHRALRQQPGRVPKGFGPAVCAHLRGKGFSVITGDLNTEVRGLCGETLGWVPGDSRRRRNTVRIDQGMSPISQVLTLLHEAGHVILGHQSTDPVTQFRTQLARQFTDPVPAEAAAELTAATVANLAGLAGEEKSLDYLAHLGPDAFTAQAVSDALDAATELWPVVEASLN
jgi:hypothetical protein